VEVYTPIPEEALHRAPHALRSAGTVIRVLALLIVLGAVVRFTFEGPPSDWRNFGVIHTQVGVAQVVCGGEFVAKCGETTALVFGTCSLSADWRTYFRMPDGRRPSDTEVDASVRRLIGKRPPSGPRWDVDCRDRYPFGHQSARLKPLLTD
jgi:hypothetical protein